MTPATEATPQRPRTAKWAAALGGVLAGLLIFVSISTVVGGLDPKTVLTFDQDGSLERQKDGAPEEIFIRQFVMFIALVLAVVIGVPLGAFIGVKRVRARKPLWTALLTAVIGSAGTVLALRGVPFEPSDHLLLPYVIFGTWFLAPFLSRLALERSPTARLAPNE
ncbi:MAG: hypothetical protein H0U53_01055 [Actinobacteria bacterium]|nr:hypothetical protein [Actinomycetota bacterium]